MTAGERRLAQFAVAFPATEKVASLMRHLSWTHFLQLLPLKTEAARWFYAHQSVESRWSVRELHHQIERKAFHRTDPTLVFKDPHFLDFLSLRRLVAIELKLDRFKAAHKGQMALLQMHKDGITVAEYWTELPPKTEKAQKLHGALLEAREQLARRGVLLGDLEEE
jgi:hypothetical protein